MVLVTDGVTLQLLSLLLLWDVPLGFNKVAVIFCIFPEIIPTLLTTNALSIAFWQDNNTLNTCRGNQDPRETQRKYHEKMFQRRKVIWYWDVPRLKYWDIEIIKMLSFRYWNIWTIIRYNELSFIRYKNLPQKYYLSKFSGLRDVKINWKNHQNNKSIKCVFCLPGDHRFDSLWAELNLARNCPASALYCSKINGRE